MQMENNLCDIPIKKNPKQNCVKMKIDMLQNPYFQGNLKVGVGMEESKIIIIKMKGFLSQSNLT